MLNSFKQLAKAHQQNRHNIQIKSVHEVEHSGSRFTVAKTNHGHLVLFPHAKKVSVHDVVKMINLQNAANHAMEQKSIRDDTATSGGLTNNRRAFHRTSGPFEITASARKAPLRVMRRVAKTSEYTTPLEEAFLLHETARLGWRVERPIAVFISKPLSAFPDQLFTTHILAEHEIDSIRPKAPYFLDQVLYKGFSRKARRRGVFIDAEVGKKTFKKMRPEVRARVKPEKIAFFNSVLAQAAALKKKVKKV